MVRVVIVAAIALFAQVGAAAQPALPIRLVTVSNDSAAEAFYGIEKGFFRRAGLDVHVTVAPSAVVPPAIASATFDVGETTVATLASAYEHGAPFVIIAPSAVFSAKRPATAGILVAKDSPIRTARDFNGKTVGVAQLQGVARVIIDAWVDKNGGDSTSVKYVEVPEAGLIAALMAGRVDAIEVSQPTLDQAIAAGARSLSSGYEAIAGELLIGAWFCTADYAAGHQETVRRFARAMAEIARWANRDQRESGEILARWSKISVSPSMTRVLYAERLDPALMQPLIDVAARYKALKAPFPALDMVAPEVRN